MIMRSIRINHEGFINSSDLIFNFSVLYLIMETYTGVCHCALKSILEVRISILEYGTVHFSLYSSIQTYTRVCSFQRQNIVTWSSILEYVKPILEYATVVKVKKLSVWPILEVWLLYLKYGLKLKSLNPLWMAYTRVCDPILEYALF